MKKRIGIGILLLLSATVFFMQTDTNGIMDQVTQAFYVSPGDGDILRHFTRTDAMDGTLKVEVRRIFALHNFFAGRIWMQYTATYAYAPGKESGSYDIPVELDIKRIDGAWRVVNIKEAP